MYIQVVPAIELSLFKQLLNINLQDGKVGPMTKGEFWATFSNFVNHVPCNNYAQNAQL